jgi:integrase
VASIRSKDRKDGTIAYRVFFRHNDRQTCYTFDSRPVAETFKTAVEQLGSARAIALHRLEREPRGEGVSLSVADWVKHHIEHLTGVDPRTVQDYQGYLRNDVAPTLGLLPLDDLSRDDVKRWVQAMELAKASAKTIANKHGFLSGALAGAVIAGHIASNPAASTRLPRGERPEMVFLTKEDFGRLCEEIPEHWLALVEFLAVSGARWSEVTALRPGDVDRRQHIVRINRAWKRGGGGYRIGPPKTRRSVRTINVGASVLDKLDYTGDWLFTNPGRGNRAVGGPVRAPNFRTNVWHPAVDRAKLKPRPRIHDLRHTCASWLIQGGQPLPAIQQHLGHESIQTTVDVYGHLDRTTGAQVAAVMGELLAREPQKAGEAKKNRHTRRN